MKKKKKEKKEFKQFRNTDKFSSYKTVKILLSSILKDKETRLDIIKSIVSDMNELVIHTYQFIRLYILKLYHDNKDFPEFNQQFILSCMRTLSTKTTRGSKNKDTELMELLNDFYNTEYKPLINHVKTDMINKTQIMTYLSITILTSLEVNIKEHFSQHLNRFINKTITTIDKKVLYQFKTDFSNLNEIRNEHLFKDWLEQHESNILPIHLDSELKPELINYDVKINPFKYLKSLLYMNSVLEKLGNIKLFQPLPLRTSIIPKNIILDTKSISKLFDFKGHNKSYFIKNTLSCKEFLWNEFLKLNSKVFKDKNYKFNNQMSTDGISCSLLFIRKDLWGRKRFGLPEQEIQEFHNIEDLNVNTLETLKNKNIIGCDPGKRSLVYMVDNKGKKLQYTSPQRMFESKSKRNKKILLIEKNKNGIFELESEISKQNSKSIDYDKFKQYLIKKNNLNNNNTIKNFYNDIKWRKMKFRTYSNKNKSIDTFINKIGKTFGNDIIIGYGNWSRSTQMKYYEPTINMGLRRLIHKKYDTITINEYNTSKICCDCHDKLENYKTKKGIKIHRLLYCLKCVSSENKKNAFKTRDINSAINIRDITTLWIKTQKRLEIFKYKKPIHDSETFVSVLNSEIISGRSSPLLEIQNKTQIHIENENKIENKMEG